MADSGQVARLAAAAGADFLLTLSAGYYRNHGISALAASLPCQNANDLVQVMARSHVVPAAGTVPVFAGLVAGDPTRPVEQRLERLAAYGVAGIVNYPSVTLLDGSMRRIFEEEGCDIEAELELLAAAKQLGLATMGFVSAEPEVAARFAAAGVDALILTPGVTRVLEDIHERRDKLQHALRLINAALEAARRVRPDLPCLAFGGPITLPEDLELLYRQSALDGFVGGSVFGRLPLEAAVSATVRRFKGVTSPRGPERQSGLGTMIGASAVMRRLFHLLERAASCELNVCIEGESGVGKELVATQIHRLSSRAAGPLVTLNCGAIPDTLLESELFGHERGAFTGADHRRLGKFELADRGTLFLDEVGDLSPRGQVALLRAIQQREITRIGGNTSIPVDNRILAATNQPLAQLVEQGKFRADLYYRLNQLTLVVPPLRERLDDLPLLVAPIVAALRVQMNHALLELAPEFLAKMHQHDWPGNLRELQHIIYQAALAEDGPLLKGTQFQPAGPRAPAVSLEAQVAREVETTRRERVRQALREAGGNKSKAATLLGITRKTLYAWLRE